MAGRLWSRDRTEKKPGMEDYRGDGTKDGKLGYYWGHWGDVEVSGPRGGRWASKGKGISCGPKERG